MRSNLIALLLPFLLHIFTTTASVPPYTPTEHILLDCGSTSNATSGDGRHWQADILSNFLPSNATTDYPIATPTENYSSITQQVPYRTARVFFSEFTYSFPLHSAGHKLLRLYFYPTTYNQHSFFSVVTKNNTLLSNFSAFLAIQPPSATLVKEYIIYVNDTSNILEVTFLPNSDQNNSYAFVNGIEIVPIPDTLYHRGENVQINFVIGHFNSSNVYFLRNKTALETVYRLNVGGPTVQATDDSGMFRTWNPDNNYTPEGTGGETPSGNFEVIYTTIAPPYTAPEIVYTSARTMDENSLSYFMTWRLPVDSGFYYLLRLHFCEIFLNITGKDKRVFTIFINNKTAELKADVSSWGGGPRVAVFRDYVAYVNPDGRKSKHEILLIMRPSTEAGSDYNNAILNGLKIFKLSLLNGNLSSPNPDIHIPVSTTKQPPQSSRHIPLSATKQPPQSSLPASENNKNKRKRPLISAVTAGAASLVVLFLGLLIIKRRKRVKESSAAETNKGESVLKGNSLCRHFSLDEIKSASNNFDDSCVIGEGGFGSVYKGHIDNNLTQVAIKRLNPLSNQGVREFLTD